MQFIKKLLTIALFVGFSIQFSFAQENEFKTDKLWKKFTKNDIETLRNINSALAKNNFDEAMNLVKVLKGNIGNEKNSLADAIVDIVLWNKFSGKIDSKKTSFADISTFVINIVGDGNAFNVFS